MHIQKVSRFLPLRTLPVLFLIFFLSEAKAQISISGKVTDAGNREPMAFVHLSTNGEYRTTTDLDGKFRVNDLKKSDTVIFSFIGYKPFRLPLNDVKNYGNLKIKMESSETLMNELVFESGDNPANRIIRKVIEARKKNDPMSLKSFSYESYNKFIWRPYFSKNTTEGENTDTLMKIFEKQHLLVMESVTERIRKAPSLDNETVKANRVSGLKKPPFAALATDLQPFSFYDPYITIFEKNYINPISNGTFRRYYFEIKDTVFQASDTVFIVSFEPEEGKNFEALKGLLYINTDGYAIQNVVAEPYSRITLDFRIRQQYAKTEGTWFPEKLSIDMRFPDYPNKSAGIGMKINGNSFLKKIRINPELKKSDFALINSRIEDAAHQKDSLFWEGIRPEALTLRDRVTYRVVDSIGDKVNLDRVTNIAGYIVNDAFPVSLLNVKLSSLVTFNNYERIRLGAGLSTNDKISRYFSVGGYAAYGLGDEEWKYGVHAQINFLKKRNFSLRYDYIKDLREPGQLTQWLEEGTGFGGTPRKWFTRYMDSLEHHRVRLKGMPVRFLQTEVSVFSENFKPLYEYDFEEVQRRPNGLYAHSGLEFRLRYAYGEKFSEFFGKPLSLGTDAPVFYLNFTKGIADFEGSLFNYEKIAGKITKRIRIKGLGESALTLEGGFINGSVPYGLLFNHFSFGADNAEAFYKEDAFQTMSIYEFAADRYLNAFWSHSFGNLLVRTKKFRPEPVLIQAVGFGFLDNASSHIAGEGITVRGYNEGFFETALHLKSLIRFKYNLYEIGIGGGVHYRYGSYAFSNEQDNVMFKLLIDVEI